MIDLDAYFARIGYEGPREPTLAVLTELHALHPAAVPFENLDPLRHLPVDISPAAVDAKLIGARRGGYCFEHNGLFQRVLIALGFAVTGLTARVRWNLPEELMTPRTHMVLRVETEDGPRLVDVGFGGCVQTQPLRLEFDIEQPTVHDTYRLTAMPHGAALQLSAEGEWRPIIDILFDPCVQADYEMGNWFTSTHPGSIFRNNLLAARTTPKARFGLFNNRLSIRPAGGEPSVQVLDTDGVLSTLEELFRLPVEPDWRGAVDRVLATGG